MTCSICLTDHRVHGCEVFIDVEKGIGGSTCHAPLEVQLHSFNICKECGEMAYRHMYEGKFLCLSEWREAYPDDAALIDRLDAQDRLAANV